MNLPAPFTKNQNAFFRRCFDCWLNVAEGGKRGGKNVLITMAYCTILEKHPSRIHLIAGVSTATARLNILDCDGFGLLNFFEGHCRTGQYQNRDCLYIDTPTGEKVVLISGGGKAGDEKLIKGNTYGTAYITEANECSEAFIQEVFDRTISSPDRKVFHDLNPKAEGHWYYKDILNFHEMRQKQDPNYGYNYGHFTIADNLSLSGDQLKAVLSTYDKKSLWYARDILGLRRSADGLVYDMFSLDENTYTESPPGLRYGAQRTIACDYGTTNDCVFLDVYDNGETVRVDREYRWASRQEHRQKTDKEYADDLIEFMGEPECTVLVDPSAASFIAELRSRGIYVRDADNDVLNGIRRVSQMFHMRKLMINKQCLSLIDELGVYSWDDKAAARGEEKPVKERDHGCDSLRYFCNSLPDWRFEGVQTQ
jgi:PBSX family phage terminase large subunit